MKRHCAACATGLAVSIAFFLSLNFVHGQGRSLFYSFDVKVNGQPAEPPHGAVENFAKVPQPIAPDARFDLDTEGEQIIVNIFAIDEKGAPLPGAQGQAKAIMVDKGTGFDLDATLDKSTLAPGLYGMNIVLENKGTSRVRFAIGTPEQLAAAKNANDTPTSGSPPASVEQPSKINMAGIDRIGATRLSSGAGKFWANHASTETKQRWILPSATIRSARKP